MDASGVLTLLILAILAFAGGYLVVDMIVTARRLRQQALEEHDDDD